MPFNDSLHSNLWIERANQDLGSAKVLFLYADSNRDSIGYLCQQAAEKYLKAFILSFEIRIPKTHDLILLANLIINISDSLFNEIDWLKQATIEVRYPRDKVKFIPIDSEKAILITELIQLFVLKHIK